MITPEYRRWVATALMMLLWSASEPVQAQLRIASAPHERVAAADVVTQFISWEGDTGIDGLSVYVPAGWTLISGDGKDDSGRFSAAFEMRAGSGVGHWTMGSEDRRIQPGELVRLTMQTGGADAALVRVMPLLEEDGHLIEQQTYAVESLWEVVEKPDGPTNRALSLAGEAEQAPLVTSGTSAPSSEDSWTLSWWMKSSGLDQVVLSTWTGYESDSYPVEAILDAGGNLTVFTGRQQHHYAMRSERLVADGTWHHVAIVHDAANRKMRMHVDGSAQDSLQFSVDASRSGGFSTVRLGYRLQDSRPDLSRPLVGQLDDVQLFHTALEGRALSEVKERSVLSTTMQAWRLDFDDDASTSRLTPGLESHRLVGSILSVRKPASDLQVRHVQDGVLLSFEPGDDDVVEYRIDVSGDGRVFRNAATIDRMAWQQGRIEWVDRTHSGVVQHYRVTALYPDGPSDTAPVIKVGSGTDESVTRVQLEGNFPNPFNPTTTIRYEVFEQEHVRVSIWDLSGQMIAQPVDGSHQPGRYEVGFDAGTLPSGTYFVRLESLSGIQTHQMILMK